MIGDCGSTSFVMKRPVIAGWSVLGCFETVSVTVGRVVDKVVLEVGVGGWWRAKLPVVWV